MAGYDGSLKYIDGPGLIKWIEGEVAPATLRYMVNTRPTLARRLFEWRHGCSGTIGAVDRVMIELDLQLAFVPAHLFRKAPADRRRWHRERHYIATDTKVKAVQAIWAGKKVPEVAVVAKVHSSTVRKWVQRVERQGITPGAPVKALRTALRASRRHHIETAEESHA